jgi:hypothetical protein
MLEQSGDALIQEQFHYGETHDHYVTSVMCFYPDGTIPIDFLQIPGAVQDSQVADYGDIYTTNLSWCIYETVQNALLI